MRGAARAAQRIDHQAAVKPHALVRQPVNVRRLDQMPRFAVGADRLPGVVVRHDEQNVGTVVRAPAGQNRQEKQNGGKGTGGNPFHTGLSISLEDIQRRAGRQDAMAKNGHAPSPHRNSSNGSPGTDAGGKHASGINQPGSTHPRRSPWRARRAGSETGVSGWNAERTRPCSPLGRPLREHPARIIAPLWRHDDLPGAGFYSTPEFLLKRARRPRQLPKLLAARLRRCRRR